MQLRPEALDGQLAKGLASLYVITSDEHLLALEAADKIRSKARAQGYSDAMTAHSLVDEIRVIPGGLTESSGYKAAEVALEFGPTALVVANDIAAIGAIAAVENTGRRVPEDVSVIGYDGISLGALRRVNLTTIAQPLEQLGRRAAERILGRIADPLGTAHRDLLSSQLAVRGTTGPAPTN